MSAVTKRQIQRVVRAARAKNPTAPALILARRAAAALGDPGLEARALAVAQSWGAR